MSERWYRAYQGTIGDPKLHEVAAIAECSRSVAIALWHGLLESCAAEASERFEVTPRRLAIMLAEPLDVITKVLSALEELGMVSSGTVTHWKNRQFRSDVSTERVKTFRAKGGATVPPTANPLPDVAETPMKRFSNPPESESESESESYKNTPLPPQGAGGGVVPEPTKPEEPPAAGRIPSDAELDRFVLAWNGAGLPPYRRTPASFLTLPNAGAVAEGLRFFRPDEVLAAITNYAQVVKHRGEFTYGATFSSVGNFLEKGLPVFVPGPFEGLRKAGAPGSSGVSPAKPKLVCAHCGEAKGVQDFCLNAKCPAMDSGAAYKFVPVDEFRRREAG